MTLFGNNSCQPPKPVASKCACPPPKPAPKACKPCPCPVPVKKPRCPCGVEKTCCEDFVSCIFCGCCDEEDFADSSSFVQTLITDVLTSILVIALLYVGYTLATGGKLVVPALPSLFTKLPPQETTVVVLLVSALLYSVGAFS